MEFAAPVFHHGTQPLQVKQVFRVFLASKTKKRYLLILPPAPTQMGRRKLGQGNPKAGNRGIPRL